MPLRWWLRALCAAAVGAVVFGCGPAPSRCGPRTARVANVVDGDTVDLEGGLRVRYLLVDAPETTAGKNDCYGSQAVNFNRSRVEGQQVQLEYDESACTDRFGRLLAYVTASGAEVNQALVQQGLACVLYVAPAGTSRKEAFLTWEAEARTARTGMWGACSVIPCSK